MTGGAVPTATPQERVDILLGEVRRLRAVLADRDAELAQLHAHHTMPLHRLALGVASSVVVVAVGTADGLRRRWRRG